MKKGMLGKALAAAMALVFLCTSCSMFNREEGTLFDSEVSSTQNSSSSDSKSSESSQTESKTEYESQAESSDQSSSDKENSNNSNNGNGSSSSDKTSKPTPKPTPKSTPKPVETVRVTIPEGYTVAQIAKTLEYLTQKVESSFVIDTLTYLQKGGRCSSVTALGASLLRLKPCIEVREGKMVVGKKFRGSFEKVCAAYVRDRLEGRTDIDTSRLFITHTCRDFAPVELVRRQVLRYGDFREILITKAGCTVSSHCGPNTLGILFLRQ